MVKYDFEKLLKAVERQRMIRGHKFADVAAATDHHPTTIHRYLNRGEIPVDKVRAMCDYAKIKVKDILLEDTNE